MKKVYALILICITLSAKADYWTQKANYTGAGSQYPFYFVIGNKGYVGTGRSGLVSTKEFWEYDPSLNTWTQKANFGGTARFSATGFSIGNKGYAGLGIAQALKKDFWEYDPVLNTWTQKANYGGIARHGAAGFAVGNFGYICTGGVGNTVNDDIWQYNPANNIWAQKTNLPGPSRRNTNCFVIGNSGYITGGTNGLICYTDLWEYNCISDTWTQKANMPDTARCDAASFTICDLGYFGTGQEPYILNDDFNDFWQYKPVTNTWIQKANVSNQVRNESAYFSIGNKGYIGLGCVHPNSFFNDFWEYTPDSACTTGIEEFPTSDLEFTISPNPANEFIVISYQLSVKEKIEINITDAQGKKVYSTKLETKTFLSRSYRENFKLQTSNFARGIYFVEINIGKERAVKRFIKN